MGDLPYSKYYDTQSQIQRSQQVVERELRHEDQLRAGAYITRHGERSGWPSEDVEEVLGALGLLEGQVNVPAFGHEDPRRRRKIF